ncbi:acyl carrier protein [Plantactinospora sp. WMMB334]|uniref:acyl carrier protein n=1 Tax=Plantactinospora sp. WMMB334 TaxID=3404119 RepID=UPI003B948521
MESQVGVADSELRQRVFDSVGRLLSRVLCRDVGEVSPATRLRDELGMTSASTLELMLELEDALAIEVDVEGLDEEHVESVATLAEYVVANARPAG